MRNTFLPSSDAVSRALMFLGTEGFELKSPNATIKLALGEATGIHVWDNRILALVSKSDFERSEPLPRDIEPTFSGAALARHAFRRDLVGKICEAARNVYLEKLAMELAVAGTPLDASIACHAASVGPGYASSSVFLTNFGSEPKLISAEANEELVKPSLEVKPLWKWMVSNTDKTSLAIVKAFFDRLTDGEDKTIDGVHVVNQNYVNGYDGYVRIDDPIFFELPMWLCYEGAVFSDKVRQFVNRQLVF